jgi:RNA recognition motif-containing protein
MSMTEKMEETHSVIIKNLSYFCHEQDLSDFLNSVVDGKSFSLIHVKIERSDKDRRSLLHGFAALSTFGGAEYVISTLNDVVFMGRKLKYVLSFAVFFNI